MNIRMLPICLGVVLTSLSFHLNAANEPALPQEGNILATLRPDHPRVMARPETFRELQALVAKGGLPAKLYVEVKTSADEILSAPVSKYEKPGGRRLLSVSRRVVDRVRALAVVTRLENDARYAERAWKELEAAAQFPDWNPAHFLDTAEMTHAFALGCWSCSSGRQCRVVIQRVRSHTSEGYVSRPRRWWRMPFCGQAAIWIGDVEE